MISRLPFTYATQSNQADPLAGIPNTGYRKYGMRQQDKIILFITIISVRITKTLFQFVFSLFYHNMKCRRIFLQNR